jgi:hypothetical protein
VAFCALALARANVVQSFPAPLRDPRAAKRRLNVTSQTLNALG